MTAPRAPDAAGCVTKVTDEKPRILYTRDMKKNLSNADRIIRVALAAVVAVLYLTNVLSPAAAVILGIVAVILLVTSFVSFCPLYRLLGISTNKKSAA